MNITTSDEKSLNNYLTLMWQDYCQMTPQAQKISDLLTEKGETIVNDHIALRTFKHPQLGIKSLSKFFEKYGYTSKGEYFFKEKKLYAQHFEHPNPLQPKIFISELELEKTSSFVQSIVSEIVEEILPSSLVDENFSFSGRHWEADYETYLKLADESEYASWVYAYGFRPNHFTVSINELKEFKQIEKLNEFLKSNGFKLNSSGGEIKGTPEELLEQSSTMAEHLPVDFKQGTYNIPACYYEFAKRYPMPDGKMYQGFIAKSADKIFESTNRR